MRQPLWRSSLWPWSVLMTIASAIGAKVISGYLDTTIAHSMVAFELAGTAVNSQKIMTAWGAEGMRLAAFSLGFDFLYIASYCTAIGLACLWAHDGFEERGWPLAGLGLLLSFGMIAAGLFDGIENYALIHQLVHGADDSCATIARVSSILKFGIMILSLIFSALGSIAQDKPIVGLLLGVVTFFIGRTVWVAI